MAHNFTTRIAKDGTKVTMIGGVRIVPHNGIFIATNAREVDFEGGWFEVTQWAIDNQNVKYVAGYGGGLR